MDKPYDGPLTHGDFYLGHDGDVYNYLTTASFGHAFYFQYDPRAGRLRYQVALHNREQTFRKYRARPATAEERRQALGGDHRDEVLAEMAEQAAGRLLVELRPSHLLQHLLLWLGQRGERDAAEALATPAPELSQAYVALLRRLARLLSEGSPALQQFEIVAKAEEDRAEPAQDEPA
jgi:hypothetical protein